MALARVLLEAVDGNGTDEQRIELVDDLVEAVVMAGGDGQASRDGKRRAEATLAKMKAGEDAIGMTRLLELLGLPAEASHWGVGFRVFGTIKIVERMTLARCLRRCAPSRFGKLGVGG